MRKAADRRPWRVSAESAEQCKRLFPLWLKERGGIVVYQNCMFDSSHIGDQSFMPARFIAEEDNQMHDAPDELRPNGGLPSLRQQQQDHIEMSEYGNDIERALDEAFKFEMVAERRMGSQGE